MNIGIVGLGLIGGTYAKALRKYPYTLYGIDIDQETIRFALENDIVDYATTDPKEHLSKLDVVFVCLYPKDAVSFIQKYIMSFKRGAIISDVVGIKRKMIDAFDMYKDDEVEFVFSHPIAGREKIGIKHSNEAIFHNANFVITPTKHNTTEALSLIQVLAKQMGFKNVSMIEDVEHDEIISYTSQLTHAIAIALMNSDDEKYNTKLFIGDSFKDLTRISMINEKLWSELFINNKDFLIKKIDAFQNELNNLKDALQTKNIDSLQEQMIKSTKRREKINE